VLALSLDSHILAGQSLNGKALGASYAFHSDHPPHLGKIIDHETGSIFGFLCSAALKALRLAWDAKVLVRSITVSQQLAADSDCDVLQGDAEIRAKTVAILCILSAVQ